MGKNDFNHVIILVAETALVKKSYHRIFINEMHLFLESLIYPLAKSDLPDNIFFYVAQPKCFMLVREKIFK